MSYLFHDEMFGQAREATTGAGLDPIEVQVVELALTDDLSSLATSRWRRAAGRLLGLRAAKPLASARLEALRRFVVLARHSRISRGAAEQLLGLGFTPDQLRAIEGRATAARSN